MSYDAMCSSYEKEIARLRNELANIEYGRVNKKLVEAIESLLGLRDEGMSMGERLDKATAALRSATETKGEPLVCSECKDGLPSVNWKNGKPYSYCPECGRTETKGEPT